MRATERSGWFYRSRVLRFSVAGVLRACLVAGFVTMSIGVAVWLLRGPILGAIGRQLVREDPLGKADVLFVLVGGTPEREIETADLYRAGWAPTVLMTHEPERAELQLLRDRGVAVESDLDMRRRLLIELGVPDAAIVIPDKLVRSTVDEAHLVRDWLAASAHTSVIVVTSNYHTGRTRMIFSKVLDPKTRLLMRGAARWSFTPDTWWHDRITLREGLIEWQKHWYYALAY